MGANTKIEWATHTWNPWWGCTNVSPACDHCYAEIFSHRLGLKVWGQDSGRRFFGNKHWHEPFHWNDAAERSGERARVFCGSMCDVMEDRRDLDILRGDLYAVIRTTPWLDWLLLTKRPQNFRRFLPQAWIEQMPANVWCGTTVETQEYLWRVDALKGVPAAVLFLSIEPLLAPMPTLGEYLGGIDWAILGGESGPGARPMHPDWARSVRDQCEANETKFFFKQWGDWGPFHSGPITDLGRGSLETGGGHRLQEIDGYTMARYGKQIAGRLLDGREWNEFPETKPTRVLDGQKVAG